MQPNLISGYDVDLEQGRPAGVLHTSGQTELSRTQIFTGEKYI